MNELSEICQCSESTISRIGTGQQQAIKAPVSDILLAVGCISPYAAYEEWSDYDSEQRSRYADARRRIDAGPATQAEVLDAILDGIHSRIYGE
ncbi:hypothetical protein [Allorhodopirellula solitaria]|nr:hypothetical protein [Allorhodopirellula solitaria]